MVDARAIEIRSIGGRFRDCTTVVDSPLAEPAGDEVLIRVHFAGVNGVYDQMMCLDRIDHTRVVPPTGAGVEAVGLVEAVGPAVTSVRPGDAVASVVVGQGYRTRQLLRAGELIRVPEATPEVMALIPSGVSALLALERVGEMKSGEVVCITAAAGGLGNIAAQIAVDAGNHVICVCGGERKAERLAGLGAARVIDYRSESLDAVLDGEYRDAIDLGIDSVGRSFFDALLRNLAPLGRLVCCGFTSDRLPTEKITAERVYTSLYWKGASVRGFMNYRYAEHAAEARARLLGMLRKGRLRPLIDPSRFAGLDSVADAVEHLLAGANVGKVVVDLRDG